MFMLFPFISPLRGRQVLIQFVASSKIDHQGLLYSGLQASWQKNHAIHIVAVSCNNSSYFAVLQTYYAFNVLFVHCRLCLLFFLFVFIAIFISTYRVMRVFLPSSVSWSLHLSFCHLCLSLSEGALLQLRFRMWCP